LTKDIKCLVDTVYYEARGESFKGQVLVAKTILNRVSNKYYPNTVCDVVYQPYQYSWTQTKQQEPHPILWYRALDAAYAALSYNSKVMYFHTKDISPDWAQSKQFLLAEGNHIFYK
jgi:spore germination cell wall hydrolase CwlJ-like protein